MPNGNFTNPRYFRENACLSNEGFLKKYGYVPRVDSGEYDCERDYLAALKGTEDYDDCNPYRGSEDDDDWEDAYSTVKNRKPSGKLSNDFKVDQFHYHRLLFQFDEKFSKVHETKHAILFEVEEGRFWVPKSLIKTKTYIKNSVLMVHKMFERNYIESDLKQ